MSLTASIAIYMLFWVLAAFLVLPFGIRTPDETGEHVRTGHADSAPTNFRPGLVILRASLLSAVLFGLFYANYTQGWFTSHDLTNLIIGQKS